MSGRRFKQKVRDDPVTKRGRPLSEKPPFEPEGLRGTPGGGNKLLLTREERERIIRDALKAKAGACEILDVVEVMKTSPEIVHYVARLVDDRNSLVRFRAGTALLQAKRNRVDVSFVLEAVEKAEKREARVLLKGMIREPQPDDFFRSRF